MLLSNHQYLLNYMIFSTILVLGCIIHQIEIKTLSMATISNQTTIFNVKCQQHDYECQVYCPDIT